MLQKVGPLQAEVRRSESPVGTVVLLHGMGLGPWMWEPWFDAFTSRRLDVIAVEMPGHGADTTNVGLDACVDAVRGVLDTLTGPVTLVGHSAMGLVAQLVAVDRELHGLVMVCSVPPGQIGAMPARDTILGALPLVPAIAAGRAVKVPWSIYRKTGLGVLEEGHAREVYDRITPWPNQLTRDLLHPPKIDPLRVKAPTLLVLGKLDPLIPWAKARVIGDLYEGVVWRYDDLGHLPPLEPNGLRMGRDVVKFAIEPVQPKVIESEGYMPNEGVGHKLRKARRGELMKLRSAYGQKKAAR